MRSSHLVTGIILPLCAPAASSSSSSSSFDRFAAIPPPSSARALQKDQDNYCGFSWPDAASTCGVPCPSGQDSECAALLPDDAEEGQPYDYKCYFFTGCGAKIEEEQQQQQQQQQQQESGAGSVAGQGGGGDVNNNYCGASWIAAMLTCNEPCPRGTECRNGETCYAATNCDKPLLELVSDMLVTLNGPDKPMAAQDGDIFSGTLMDILKEVAEQEGIALDGLDLGDQEIQGRRQLEQRRLERFSMGFYDDHYLFSRPAMTISNITQRKLPSGSSALDVSVVITGDYRPPPYIDLNVIAEDSINRQGEKVVSSLRERGSRSGRDFFDRVDSIEAVAKEKATARPTRAPTGKPSPGPTGTPTFEPSLEPSSSPSDLPSSQPSRAHLQSIMTGSREDLAIGGSTTTSYGYVFNMRTTPAGPVVVLNGLDFYTESTDIVEFELWSRLGSFKDAKGNYEGWDLIASGTVEGRGFGRYTAIPEDMFTQVSIPGGGGERGTRAFYLTLTTIDLVYKKGSGADSDQLVQAKNPDLEVYEGEGVLFYPFPDPSDAYYYRGPRQFLGAIHYDRLPCKPYSAFGDIMELPCPDLPTGSPTKPPPTASPSTKLPTLAPVTEAPTTRSPISGQTEAPVSPTMMPTGSPTVSVEPTAHPTTSLPTASPIVPMRGNIIVTLRNTPERLMTDREIEKFLEITTDFLIRHTDSSMIIDGIDFWHQELIHIEGTLNSTIGKEDSTSIVDSEHDQSEHETSPSMVSRGTREKSNKVKKQPELPQIPATEVTLILRVTHSNLPLNLIGKMASVAIEEKQIELLALLNEQSAFYTYFKFMDGLESKMIERVTKAPTLSPTTYEAFLANQAVSESEEGVVIEEKEELGFGVLIGFVVGSIWCLLTACSVAYLYKARSEMTEEKDLEDLMKQEKANPLETPDNEGDAEKKVFGESNTTVPLGNSENGRHDNDDLSSVVSSEMTDSADEESEGGTRWSSSVIGRSSSMPVSDKKRSLSILRKISSSRELFGHKRSEEPAKTQGWKGRAKRRNAPQTKSLNDATMYGIHNNARTNRPQSLVVGRTQIDDRAMTKMRVRQSRFASNGHRINSFDLNRQSNLSPKIISHSNNADFDEPSKTSSNDASLYGSVSMAKTSLNADLGGSYNETSRASKATRGKTTRSMVSKSVENNPDEVRGVLHYSGKTSRGSFSLGNSLKASQRSHSRSRNKSPEFLNTKSLRRESIKGSIGKSSSSGSIQKLNSTELSSSLKNQVEIKDFGKKNKREGLRRKSSSM